MSYKIYQHTNLINGKIYIGITCQKPESRWGVQGSGYNKQPKFYKDILKYGWDNFSHEILEDNLSKEQALQKENELILKLNTIQNGYNISYSENVASKRIICLTTGEIFDSITEAAEYGNVSDSNLSHYLRGEWDNCGQKDGQLLQWEYLDFQDLNLQAQKLRLERKEKRESKYYTSEAFEIIKKYQNGESIRQLAKDYQHSKERIHNLLEFHGIPILSSKERISRSVVQLDKNKKPIQTFESLDAAARAIGITKGNSPRIAKACDEEWRTVKGYYWRWNK